MTLLLLSGFCGPLIGQEYPGRHHLFSELLARYVENGRVDYPGFASDPRFDEYLSHLSSIDPNSLSDRDEELALWINAYNAYTIKLIIDRLPLSSIRDISLGWPMLFGPWSIEFADVGGTEYTLNEIEHDIIREEFRDPRIHFALVCAAKSCPDLRDEAYEGSRLDSLLENDAIRFIRDTSFVSFDYDTKTVTLSKLFDWYESDFEESAGSVRMFLMRYIESDSGKEFLWSGEIEYKYFPYDWSLNEQ